MNLSRDRVEQLALDYVGKHKSDHYRMNLLSVELSKVSDKYWTATFEVRTSEGDPIEGPVFILVDDELEQAMSLDEAVQEHIRNQ